MGTLVYGQHIVSFDDRVLAHVQIVVAAKLRRGEGFFFSWKDGAAAGGGRSSVWLGGAIELQIRYSSVARQTINREWLELLTLSANSPQGLQLCDEPAESFESSHAAQHNRVEFDHHSRAKSGEPTHETSARRSATI
jgi:hypothetical protein